jgi:hypothetical protein
MRKARRRQRGEPLRADLTAVAGVVFPADVVAPLSAPGRGNLQVRLAAEDADGGVTALAEVELTRRAMSPDGLIVWWGQSQDGLLAVRLAGRPAGEWSLSLHANGVPERIGGMLRVLTMLEALEHATQLVWSSGDGTVNVRGPVGRKTLTVADGYGRYLRALGRLAEHVEQDLPVPALASPDNVRDVVVAAALLDGLTVREPFDDAVLLLATDELDEFRAGPLGDGPVQVTCGQTWEVPGLGADLSVPITVTYVSAHVPQWPAPSAARHTRVVLRPWQTSDALIRLREDEHPPLELSPLPRIAVSDADGEALVPPAPPEGADWVRDEGRWAAVRDGRVVAVADAPAELLTRLARDRQEYDSVVALKPAAWDSTPDGM